MKDSQLSKVWDVHHAYPGPMLSAAEFDKQIGRVSKSAWWKREWQAHRPLDPQPQLIPGSGSNCTPTYSMSAKVAYMPRSHASHLSIMHQLAHLLVPMTDERPYHGIEWARAQLAITRRWMGPDAAKDLRRLYTEHRVRARVIGDEARAKHREQWYRRQSSDGAERAVELLRRLQGGES